MIAATDIRNRVKDLRYVRAGDLLPNPANWRTHPTAQADALRGVLDEIGMADALLARETPAGLMLIDGHLRADTAPDVEWPVLVLDLDEAEAAKLLVTLDPLAAMAEADTAKLDALLREVNTGSAALQEMLADLAKDSGLYKTPEVTDDEIPDPPADPVTKLGDIWRLGEHRLLCGDSTDAECVARVLDGSKPFIMVTDPPYGVEYENSKGAVTNDHLADWRPAYDLFHGAVAYVWHAERTALDVGINLRESRFEIRGRVVWVKPSITMSRGHYHFQHEGAWYGVRTGCTSKWRGDTRQSTVWKLDREDHAHPTVKPVECMARPIRNHGGKGDDVYDPFCGSGTTIIAAEQLERRCFAIELSPVYCDVAVQRWEKLTGRKAELETK